MNEEENASKGITVAIVRHCFNCYHVLICAGTKCMFCICVHHNTVSNIKSNIRGVFFKKIFPLWDQYCSYLSIYLSDHSYNLQSLYTSLSSVWQHCHAIPSLLIFNSPTFSSFIPDCLLCDFSPPLSRALILFFCGITAEGSRGVSG